MFCDIYEKKCYQIPLSENNKNQYSNCQNKLNRCYIKFIRSQSNQKMVKLKLHAYTSCFLYVLITCCFLILTSYLLILNTYYLFLNS